MTTVVVSGWRAKDLWFVYLFVADTKYTQPHTADKRQLNSSQWQVWQAPTSAVNVHSGKFVVILETLSEKCMCQLVVKLTEYPPLGEMLTVFIPHWRQWERELWEYAITTSVRLFRLSTFSFPQHKVIYFCQWKWPLTLSSPSFLMKFKYK